MSWGVEHPCKGSTVRVLNTALSAAWQAIRAGEQITFDYETTEWDMAEPFTCWQSQQVVRGFKCARPAPSVPVSPPCAPRART